MSTKAIIRKLLLATTAILVAAAPIGASAQPQPPQSRSTRPEARRPAPPGTPQRQSQTARNRRWDWNTYRQGVVPPNWNQYRNTFNMRQFQRNERAVRRYNGPTYAPPRNWRYQRWVFGQVMPSIYWTRTYWIFDYWMFGLIDPPYGFVWVRFGPDAVLVDVHSGVILRVVYGVFF